MTLGATIFRPTIFGPTAKVFSRIIVLFSAVFLLSSCAYHGAAYIKTNPPGAEVVDMEDDSIIGVTPVKVWWKESASTQKFVNIRLHKDGYQDKTTSFNVVLRHKSRDSAMGQPQNVVIDLAKEE